mmetsp:Transcript_132799/g.216330  ORF Transcript_132799/g.216330 Transcript_132799/m.216330 type:complete len:84 (-) Transcript_132799:605-856(-)
MDDQTAPGHALQAEDPKAVRPSYTAGSLLKDLPAKAALQMHEEELAVPLGNVLQGLKQVELDAPGSTAWDTPSSFSPLYYSRC